MMSRSKQIQSAKLLTLLMAIAIFIVLLGPNLFGKGNLNLGFVFLNKASSSKAEERKYQAIWKSERFFTEASGFPESEEHAKRGLGFAAWQSGEKANAIQLWKEAKIPVEDLVAFGNHANMSGKRDEALSWYEAAATVDLAVAATPLAQQYHALRNYKEAIDIWQDALVSYPENPQRLTWWLGLSSSLRGNQEFLRAEEVSRKALNEFPDNPQLLTSLGSTLLGLDADFGRVESVLHQSVSLDENYADTYAVMAQLMSRENRFEESFDYFDQAIKLDPTVKWWHVARANNARNIGNLEEAKTYLLETIDLFPNYAPSYYELAWVYKLADEPNQAQNAIKQALNLYNSPPLNYYVRAGDIYAWSNELDLARSAYQRATELAPHDQRIIQKLNSLGESE